MNQFLPWHTDELNRLHERWRSGLMPHALLFTGVSGIGKNHFAKHFAELLFCGSESALQSKQACGQCQGCKLTTAGTHPDYRLVESDNGKAIPIDTIRGVSEFLTLKSQFSSMQVVIISPADKLNTFAANSLLKTLEEPTPDTLLILVTNRPERLLPTIRSRCQTVPFQTPEPGLANRWLLQQFQENGISPGGNQGHEIIDRLLALADGAPLAALAFAENDALSVHDTMLDSFEKLAAQALDPVSEASNWSETGASQSIKWLIAWTMEMIRLKSGAILADNSNGAVDHSAVKRHRSRLKKLSEQVELTRLFAWLDKLTESSRLLDSQVNQQLMLEDLLIGWSRLGKVQKR